MMKKFLKISLSALASAIFATTLLGALKCEEFFFKKGDKVCFAGDSITFAGEYMAHIQLYCVTRFPEKNLEFFNCGISGDKAFGVKSRTAGIFRYNPTVITLMIGMNDVESGLYGPQTKVTDAVLAKREAVDKRYFETMPALMELLTSEGARLVAITPSIYDETAVLKRENWAGRAATLEKYSAFIKDEAPARVALVVDFNSFMTQINLREQQKDPAFTIVGEDRVHPRGKGAFVMAYKFLKDAGAPACVAELELDAANGEVSKSENCELSNFKKTKDGVRFELSEGSLPMPVMDIAEGGEKLVDFYKDLNREILCVKNLADGDYELAIGGSIAGKYSAKQLAEGVNLAENTHTYQYEIALSIASCVAEYRQKAKDFVFNIEQIEHHNLKSDMADNPLSDAEYVALANEKLSKLDPKSKDAKLLQRYLAAKAKQGEYLRELAKLRFELNEKVNAAVNVKRVYELKLAHTVLEP